MKSPVARLIAWGLGVLICIACMWMSLHLALLHFRTSTKDTGGLLGDVCTSFATSSCEKVAQSRYAWFPPLPDKDEAKEQQGTPGAGQLAEQGDENDMETASAGTKAQEATPRVPTAQLGLAYFSFILCWLLFTGPRPATRNWPHVLFVIGAALGLPFSIFFEVKMWTQLDAWCPLCLATHVGTLLLTVLALLLWPRFSPEPGPVVVVPVHREHPPTSPDTQDGLFGPAPATQARRWSSPTGERPTTRMVVMTAICALLLVGVEHFFILNQNSIYKGLTDKFYRAQYEKKWMQYERHWVHNYWAWSLMPQVNIPVEGRPVRGEPGARHTVVLFSDFECPGCAKFEAYVKQQILGLKLASGQPGFKVIFKHWPLCKDCNGRIEGKSIHPAACDASRAVEAARLVGGDAAFWGMHDLLFANQAAWKSNRDFLPYARQLKLDLEEFKKAMVSDEAMDRIRADIDDGFNLGNDLDKPELRAEIKVDSTPTIFVDGKRLNSPQRARTWQQIMATPPPVPADASPAAAPQGAAPAAGPRVATPAGPRTPQSPGPRVTPPVGPRAAQPSPPGATQPNPQ